MKKIKIIASLLLLSAGVPLFAQTKGETGAPPKGAERVCARECASIEPETTTLNKRNRYTKKGAMQRRMYSRFMHSSIKPVKLVCDCTICHVVTASEDKTAVQNESKAERKKTTKEQLRKKKRLYPRHIRVR